jgi:hypothetical protein
MPRKKKFLHFYPPRAAPHQEVLGQLWNGTVQAAANKAISAVMPVAVFMLSIIMTCIHLKKNQYIHFEKEHTSQTSQKHANYPASLQSPFALISYTGERSCMVCGTLVRKSDEILSFCRGRIKIRETTSIYY